MGAGSLKKPGFVLLVFTAALLTLAGSYGWLHAEALRFDNNWFMMCGKSWMSGLTPYVDFTDSKGPLLWLIYGLAYLITPRSFGGMFLFDLLFYWGTFMLLYKTAFIMLRNAPQSLLATMAMAFFFFYPGMHQEVLIEDYCHLFNAMALYAAVRVLYEGEYRDSLMFWTGAALGAALMMKYSAMITLLAPAGMILLYLLVKRRSFWRALLLMAGGFAAVVLPFVVYLAAAGALDDFLREYFFNTGVTILNAKESIDGEAAALKKRWPFNIIYLHRRDQFLSEFLRLVLVGFLMSLYVFRRSKWLLALLVLWYGGSLLLYSITASDRYFMSLCIFAFGGLLFLAAITGNVKMPGAILGGAVMLGVLAVLLTHYYYSEMHFPGRDRASLEKRQHVGALINAEQQRLGRKPTLMYYHTSDFGEHTLTDAVAGARYWSVQHGMSDGMMKAHDAELREKHPDIVIIKEEDKEELDSVLRKEGYHLKEKYMPLEVLYPGQHQPRYIYFR